MSKTSLIEWAKDSPQIGALGLTVFGLTLNEWVAVATVGWAVVRLLSAAVEFYWKWKDRRDGKH